MKKQYLALFCIAAMLFTLVACSESATTPMQTNDTRTVTTPSVAEGVRDIEILPLAPTERNVERWFRENEQLAFEGHFDPRWASALGDYPRSIILERLWKSEYEETHGVTFHEAWLEHLYARAENRINNRNSLTGEAVFTEIAQIFESFLPQYAPTTNESALAIDSMQEMHTELVWGDALRSGERLTESERAIRDISASIKLIKQFSFTQEEFSRAYERDLIEQSFWSVVNVRYLGGTVNENFVPPSENILFSHEINLLFSDDTLAIKRAALNPWAIMVGDVVYSAQWLIDHSPEDWAAADIPPEAIESAFEVFRVALSEYQISKFEAKLEEFKRIPS